MREAYTEVTRVFDIA